jgi:hypothetical protein
MNAFVILDILAFLDALDALNVLPISFASEGQSYLKFVERSRSLT